MLPTGISRIFIPSKGLSSGLLVLLASAGLLSGSAPAEDRAKYYTLHLTQERICKDCTWRWLNAKQVELTNKQGQIAVVEGKEILGYDKHPILRKTLIKGLHGIGLPGPVIVPYAFDDYRDYVCKYCDK